MDTREPRRIATQIFFAHIFFAQIIFTLTTIMAASAPTRSEAQQANQPAGGEAEAPVTVITDTPLDDIGTRTTTRPVLKTRAEDLQPKQRRISDALNIIPGIQVRTESGPGLNVRGSQSSARVLAIQDGVPLNFSDGVGFNPLFIATENLESVGLLKGPSSSLFGRDALAGALEFRSERLNRPKFFAGAGSTNTSQIFAGAPITKPSKNLSAQVTAFQTHSDGNFSYTVPRQGGEAKRTRNNSETIRSTLLASGKLDRLEFKTFHLYARQIGSIPDSIYSTYPSSFQNWGEMSLLNLGARLSENFAVSSRTSFKYLSQIYDQSPESITTSIRQGLSTIYTTGDTRVEIFGETAAEHFKASSITTPDQNLTINEIGASVSIPINDRWNLQPAFRSTSEAGGFSPSIGAIGTDENEWKYFANYSEGYSPPMISQRYSRPFYIGNPDLKSEHSTEFDLGFEKKFKETFIHFEAFSRDLQNLIENQTISFGVTTPRNVGRARATGFELQGSYKWELELQAGVSYLYNRKLDVDEPVLFSPEYQFFLAAKKSWQAWTFTLQDTHWAKFYDRDFTASGRLIELSGWNTLDLFVDFLWSEHVSTHLAIFNIFDQPRELGFGYPEPQRSFMLTLWGAL